MNRLILISIMLCSTAFAESKQKWDQIEKAVIESQVAVTVQSAVIGNGMVMNPITRENWTIADEKLVLDVELENMSDSVKRTYTSWAETTDEDLQPKLTDDLGNEYKNLSFNRNARDLSPDKITEWGVRLKRTATTSQSLYSEKPVLDVLYFEPPVKKARTLFLILPGAAFGGEKDIRIKIPIAKLKGK